MEDSTKNIHISMLRREREITTRQLVNWVWETFLCVDTVEMFIVLMSGLTFGVNENLKNKKLFLTLAELNIEKEIF